MIKYIRFNNGHIASLPTELPSDFFDELTNKKITNFNQLTDKELAEYGWYPLEPLEEVELPKHHKQFVYKYELDKEAGIVKQLSRIIKDPERAALEDLIKYKYKDMSPESVKELLESDDPEAQIAKQVLATGKPVNSNKI